MKRFCMAFVIGHAVMAATATAEPTVTISPSGGGTSSVASAGGGKWTVSLSRTAGTTSTVTFTVRASDTEPIRFVLVDLNSSIYDTDLLVLPKSGSDGIASLDAINEFEDSTGLFTVEQVICVGNIGADLSGSDRAITADAIGAITVTQGDILDDLLAQDNSVGSVTVGGDLQGSITSTSGNLGSVIVAGAIGPSGSINIHAMDGIGSVDAASINASIDGKVGMNATGIVHRVATTSGDFNGSLTTRIFASLSGVTAGVYIAGDMNATVTADQDLRTPFEVDGDLNGPMTLRSVWVGTGLDGYIQVGGNVNADITITDDIKATGGETAFIDIAGNLAADILIAEQLDGTIVIGGSITTGSIQVGTSVSTSDINGAITIGNDVEAGGSIICADAVNANITITDDLGGLVNIGGSLLSGKSIAAQSLSMGYDLGQVIINSLNPGTPGTWSGSVTINGTTLSPTPHYGNTGLAGAVGIVPFALHNGDCIPVNGQQTPSDYHVDLYFYGPVTWDIEEGLPVNIF